MSRFPIVSSDCHVGPPPERCCDCLDPEYREDVDRVLAIEVAQREELARLFLGDEFDERWKAENWDGLAGAGDHDARVKVLDSDGVAVDARKTRRHPLPTRLAISCSPTS